MVAGRRVSLYDIEHDISRRLTIDPRIHFAVVCAAKGCAKINKDAYIGKTIEAALEAQTDKFVLNTQNVDFDHKQKVVRVSKLFSWFPLIFSTRSVSKPFPFRHQRMTKLCFAISFRAAQRKCKSDSRPTMTIAHIRLSTEITTGR